ncbi:hypothetical protein EJ110_NYTH18261 [Nymphaea thermarum]|nr:hypothetical protein EJ110_NYTH18261 [Nymphaea thermarum]
MNSDKKIMIQIGLDTRKGFIAHPYDALVTRGISTFIVNVNLEKGERVNNLSGWIERLRMFVPIISKGYTDSKSCLRVISKMEAEPRRLIIPVLFGVDPSHVGNLKGPLKRKFESHENNEELKQKVSDWKNVLSEVGKISGFNLKDANGYALSHLSPLFSL